MYNILQETYTAMGNDLKILSAIGIRTSFDCLYKLLELGNEQSFQAKLKKLLEKGLIGKDEKDILDILIDAGSAAAHRGWEPSIEQLNPLMDTMETFVYKHLVLNSEVKKLKGVIPKKK